MSKQSHAIALVLAGVILAAASSAARGQTSQPASAPASQPSKAQTQAASAPTSQPASQPSATAAAPLDPVEQWIQKVKQPVPWFKWGADLRLREEYWNNATTIQTNAAGHETNRQRYRPRVWTTFAPVKDIEINARLTWEFMNYCEPTILNKRDFDGDEAIFDTLNVKWSNVLNLPDTLIVGRQDMFNDKGGPAFGDGWLIMDGTPLDGSRTFYLDAIRNIYELKQAKTTVDTIYIQQYADADHYIEPFNNRNKPLSEQNEKGAVLWVTNKSLSRTELDGYFIYKHDEKVLANGDNGDIYTFGGRAAQDINDQWRYRAELAGQWGEMNAQELAALGFNSQIAYSTLDRFKDSFRLSYEYLSGADPGSNTTNQFNPLWGRWPQWSELMTLRYSRETSLGYITNLQRVGPGWTINPLGTDKFDIRTDYYLLFANDNTKAGTPGFSTTGLFRGQLITMVATYKFNEHVRTRVIGEVLFPGDYYASSATQTATFFRYELVFLW